jgi:hypothetical protein
MSAEERCELLAHLKAKWAAINAAYLKFGFVLDIEVCSCRGFQFRLGCANGGIVPPARMAECTRQ